MAFRDDLFDLLRLEGMTQKQIADRVGVSQAMVSKYLRGTIPSQTVRAAFWKEFHISTTEEERETATTQGRSLLTVDEAAKLLHIAPETVRQGLRKERLPIGVAVPCEKSWVYIIPKVQFTAFTGIRFGD